MYKIIIIIIIIKGEEKRREEKRREELIHEKIDREKIYIKAVRRTTEYHMNSFDNSELYYKE